MKKLSVNKNDKYLINEMKHEKRLAKMEAFKKLMGENSRDFYRVGIYCGCLIFSLKSIKEIGGMMIDAFDSLKHSLYSGISSNNDQEFGDIINNGYVSVFNISMSLENNYYFENNHLFSKDGNEVTLEKNEDPIYFYYCNLDYQTLNNIRLKEAYTKDLYLKYSSIDNKCIECFPESVEELNLAYCFYLNDLSLLPKQCPNIKVLYLDCLPSLKDFSFLYAFENLEEVTISDSAYITEDLINYLDSHGIKHNLSETDVQNNKITDDIINEIITPDMSDKEKIQKICSYVLENIDYDINISSDSNLHPLGFVLENNKGVCTSYAYLTNILLEKANIKTYLVTDDDHAWNMINLDGKYYYIDNTSIDSFSFDKLLLDVFNVGLFYMGDTEDVTMAPMSSLQSGEVNIPIQLLEDVLKGRNEKDVIEKYGQIAGMFAVYLCYAIKAFMLCLIPHFVVSIKRSGENILYDYKYYKEEAINNL